MPFPFGHEKLDNEVGQEHHANPELLFLELMSLIKIDIIERIDRNGIDQPSR